MQKCKHCKELITTWTCLHKKCNGAQIDDECKECHDEAVHGVMLKVTHIVGRAKDLGCRLPRRYTIG